MESRIVVPGLRWQRWEIGRWGRKKAMWEILVSMETFCILTVSKSISWLWFYTIDLQDTTIVENWIKNASDLSVLFLITRYKSSVISKKKASLKNIWESIRLGKTGNARGARLWIILNRILKDPRLWSLSYRWWRIIKIFSIQNIYNLQMYYSTFLCSNIM